MTLTAGTRLGPYHILSAIGAGGMGEVYRARDTRLGREVAIKVLPEAFSADAERMARLHREAQLLASLNHPNIASIYGFEDSGGTHALVMELVEGPTLADRIKSAAIPLDETLPIAKQIAEGLEYAHERSIVHRDLKPSNIKLAANDAVKILDFGLAKALEGDISAADISSSPTISRMATQAGIILGTAAYMSPEQAKGKSVDRRTDIWAFGCVLYEMLTGRMAFSGETVTDTLAAVIKSEPDWSPLPAGTPQTIRNLLQRCLKKDARQRLQSIGEARIAVEEILSGAPQDTSASSAFAAPKIATSFWRRNGFLWAIAGFLIAGAFIAVSWLVMRKPNTPAGSVHLSIEMPATHSLVNDGESIAISPDGRQIAFVASSGGGSSQIWLRQLDDFTARPIPDTEGGRSPFFSPDGQWLGFFAGNKLEKIPVAGGVAQVLCSGTAGTGSATWTSDGTIYFSGGFGALMTVSGYGGQCRSLLSPDQSNGAVGFGEPWILPDGKSMLVSVDNGFAGEESSIALLSLNTLKLKTLIEAATNPAYIAPGYLLFARSGALWAVRFDLREGHPVGPSAPIINGIADNSGGTFSQFAVSSSGMLVYAPGSQVRPQREVVEVDRKGAASVVTPSPAPYEDLSLSPDGNHLALTIEGEPWNIWTYDLVRKTLARLTFENDNRDPIWTADGKDIAYTSLRNGRWGIYEKPGDGSGREHELFHSTDWTFVCSFSPDGRTMSLVQDDQTTGADIWLLSLDATNKPRIFLQTQATEWFSQFSPDGRWIAYESNESGRSEIYVQSAGLTGGKWQISTGGGVRPVWPRKDSEIFYRSGNALMAVPVQISPGFSAGTPRTLFQADYFDSGHDFDVTADGQHFFFIKSLTEASAPAELHVVLDWARDLASLMHPSQPQ